MGKNLRYGEFDFGEPKTAMKKGGMCEGYAKGGPKKPAKAMKREPEAMVLKEVALLKKAGAPKAVIEHEVRESKSPIAMKKGGQMTEGERKSSPETDTSLTEGERARAMGRKNYAKGGSVASKLEKHANMPAGKAHGPGGAQKLAKGGVPAFSKVPKFGQSK